MAGSVGIDTEHHGVASLILEVLAPAIHVSGVVDNNDLHGLAELLELLDIVAFLVTADSQNLMEVALALLTEAPRLQRSAISRHMLNPTAPFAG
jgi:hypothetical protein